VPLSTRFRIAAFGTGSNPLFITDFQTSSMKIDFWRSSQGIILFLLAVLSLSCQKKNEVRGVHIEYRQTASTSYDMLELLAPDGETKSLRFVVSGTQLEWTFDDLNSDGKSDLTISSEIHKTYFAKFLIQDTEPRIQLLGNKGITVTKMPPRQLIEQMNPRANQ
jgi:hypothetical protein